MPRKNYCANLKTASHYRFLLIMTAVFIISLFITPFIVAQAAPLTTLETGISFAGGIGLGTTDPRVMAANIIRMALGVLGIIAVIIILYAGFLWMTSQGESDKIEKAKKMMINGLIGLVIILASYAIASFVISKLLNAINEGGTGGPGENNGGYNDSGYLGGGILRDVYPEPGAKDVPKNTMIIATFAETMDPLSVINTADQSLCPNPAPKGDWWCGTILEKNGKVAVKILKLNSETIGLGEEVSADKIAIMTKDKKNFIMRPAESLKTANYSVTLTQNWLTAAGKGAFISGYTWSFAVGLKEDKTSPKVISIFPAADQEVKRNAIVQVNFNEAVNFLGLGGKILLENGVISASSSVQHFVIGYQDGQSTKFLSGEVVLSNGFKTAEFISDSVCLAENGQPIEKNSCGVTPTCLPGAQKLNVLLKAATVNNNFTDIFSGITDLAGNSLDGNKNNIAEGGPADNYAWSFTVGKDFDLTAPYLIKVEPAEQAIGVPQNSQVKATFSEQLESGTLNNDNIKIFKDLCRGQNFPTEITCYPVGGFIIYNQAVKEKVNGNDLMVTQAKIKTYSPYLEPLTTYNPRFTNKIKDLYQNCLDPRLNPAK